MPKIETAWDCGCDFKSHPCSAFRGVGSCKTLCFARYVAFHDPTPAADPLLLLPLPRQQIAVLCGLFKRKKNASRSPPEARTAANRDLYHPDRKTPSEKPTEGTDTLYPPINI